MTNFEKLQTRFHNKEFQGNLLRKISFQQFFRFLSLATEASVKGYLNQHHASQKCDKKVWLRLTFMAQHSPDTKTSIIYEFSNSDSICFEFYSIMIRIVKEFSKVFILLESLIVKGITAPFMLNYNVSESGNSNWDSTIVGINKKGKQILKNVQTTQNIWFCVQTSISILLS